MEQFHLSKHTALLVRFKLNDFGWKLMMHEALYYHYMHFIMLQHAIPRSLNETQCLYEIDHNWRRYDIC